MGFPFEGPAEGPPRSESPPPRSTDEAPADPVFCLHCRRRLAVVLPHVDCAYHQPIFCSERCASDFAHEHVVQHGFTRCSFCGDWTDEEGYCFECDQIVGLVDDSTVAEMLADEVARKAVECEY